VGKPDNYSSVTAEKRGDNLACDPDAQWDDHSDSTAALVADLMYWIICGLRDIAVKESWPPDKLYTLHNRLKEREQLLSEDDKIFSYDGDLRGLLRPKILEAWGRIFRLGLIETSRRSQWSKYARLKEKFDPQWKVAERHLHRVRIVLEELKIISNAPAYGAGRSSWRQFLHYVYDEVQRRKSQHSGTLAIEKSQRIHVAAPKQQHRERGLIVPEMPSIIRASQSSLPVRGLHPASYGPASRILEELIEMGRAPLEGGLTEITEHKLTDFTDALHEFANRDYQKVEQADLLAVCGSLLRLGRCDPRLHTRWRVYEDWLLEKATSPQSAIIRSEIQHRPTRDLRERQVLELRHLQDVVKYAHREVFSSPPDPESALNLDVPHLELSLISIEMARLNDQGKPEKVIALYHGTAKAIIDKYKHIDIKEISLKLFREPNADIDFKTGAAHIYRDVSNAYVILASKQSAREKRETLNRAREFIEMASDWYSSVEPPWLHGIATLSVTKYVFEMLYGSYEEARELRQKLILQLQMSGDLTRLRALGNVREDDPRMLLQFLPRL
jgi:hypothetical protein